MLRPILALFFILTVINDSLSQSPIAGLPFIRNFSTLEYRAGIQNWDIVQDSRGIVYIANNFGLLEFDGSRWQIHPVNNGSKMRSAAIHHSGRVYVGCQGEFGYFFPDAAGRLNYTSLADSLPKAFRNFDETWNLFIDGDQTYFCTFTNIFIFNRDSVGIVQPDNPLELSFFVNRELLVDERGRGLTVLRHNHLELVPGGEFFRDIRISSILPLHTDHYLIATFSEGIYEYNLGKIKPWLAEHQSLFREAIVNCMVRLRNGHYAIGTQNQGLLIMNEQGQLMRQFTSGKGLVNRTVLSVLEDDLQNLWIGLNNGLSYVELGSPFSFINEQSGLPGTGYAAYLDQSALYLGTNTGLYRRDLKRAAASFELVEGTQGQVYHVGKYDQDILMGHHAGAFRIEGNRAVMISQEPGSWIFQPVQQSADHLVGGLYGGLQVLKKQQGHWAFDRKLEGFRESSRVMKQDRDGNLWVTHGYKGVFRLNKDFLQGIQEVSFYGREKGFPSNVLINVYPVRNELVFTSEQGIYQYNRSADRFQQDPFFTSLLGPTTQLWSIQEDALGRIYFLGRDQMGVMRKKVTGDYEVEPNAFNPIRRFLNDDLETMIILNNNEVLFGAKEGFIHYDPNFRNVRERTFKTLVREFSVISNGDSVVFFGNYIHQGKVTDKQPSGDRVELPYKHNSVSIEYAATSFESDEQVQHQYYLEKFEKGWSEWTTLTQKEYTNLREGTYTFHVRSRNAFGEVSEAATFSFMVLPPWYRTVWAYGAYVMLIMVLLFVSFTLLDRKYKHEQRVMVLQQKKELIRKDNEMEKLSQKNQEEITRLTNEKLESELRHKNKELATSTVLILNKNEFISHLKDNLKSVSRRSTQEELTKELSKLVSDIEGNLSSDADWEHFQVHFDNVHGDFSRRFRAAYPNLSPQDMKLSAYLRMNLSTKEIANLLNISVRGVEISRYRLRKKLQLDRSLNLQEFILNF
jgi:ligand-binding sensor domain-containing protein/DNA-binding CsgD family transcriptional regulator